MSRFFLNKYPWHLTFLLMMPLASNAAPSNAAPKVKAKGKAPQRVKPKMTLDEQLQDAVNRAHRAAHAQRAIQLLDQGANPNAYNGLLFCSALGMGKEELVRAFLRHGAKVTPKALNFALSDYRKTRRMTEILLNHGADPNAVISYRAYSDEDVEVSSVLYTPLMVAIAEDNPDARKLLMERGANLHTRLPNGLTALKVAAQQEDLAFCKLLLNHKVGFQGAERDLLSLTVEKNDTAFFDRLKKLGALPHPLQWPVGLYNLSLPMAQRMLAAGASPNVNRQGKDSSPSPLEVAAQNKDWLLAEFLLDNGAHFENLVLADVIPERRLSPAELKLHEESLTGEKEDPFFSDEDEDWRKRQKKELAENQRHDLRGLQLFLKHGAAPNLAYAGPPLPPQATDKRYLTRYTNTPLHVAASNNSKGAITLLLQAGAKIEAKNSLGMTPLLTAVEQLSNEAIAVLLDAGANIEARDENGSTPLILASAYNPGTTYYAPIAMVVETGDSSSLVQLLLQRGANVKAANSTGVTALHGAAATGNLASMRFLLESGAELEAANNEGLTPLGATCLSGEVEAARLLLQHGANPDFPAGKGHTPRQIASQTFTMQYKVVGEEAAPQMDKFSQQIADSYSSRINEGRRQIAKLFKAIPAPQTPK